jgi:propanol-preferring alcohol dehydrogenase
MKAAVVRDFTQPLSIEDVSKPEPGEGQVLVRIEACGLCHTDIHAAHGDWPIQPHLPLIPGHEGVGIVEALGPGAGDEISEGDRVAIPWLGFACGHCRYCNSGRETLCEAQINTGYGMDGGYAEYVAAYARHVVKVPDGVDTLDAAPLSCAGVTVYKAVKSSEVGPSELCAIFGVGGLGHLAVQYAKIQGATVVAVDLEYDKLEMAKELGADYVINAAEQDPAAEIQKLGGADAAIALAVSARPFEQAFDSLARGGTLMMVALPPDNYADVLVPGGGSSRRRPMTERSRRQPGDSSAVACAKKCQIASVASGPRGSVWEPPGAPPDHACPSPSTLRSSCTRAPRRSVHWQRV